MTPFELGLIHRAAGHDQIHDGHRQSQSLFHALLAIAPEWGNRMLFFDLVRLMHPFAGFFGQAKHATIGGSGGRKAGLVLVDGVQRRVRQLFVPGFRDFKAAWSVLETIPTGPALPAAIRRYGRRVLPFER